MSYDLLLQVLVPLIAALGGAIIGGIFSYKGSINATNRQIDNLYAQEKENRIYMEKQQMEAMRQALLTESRENLNIAQSWGGNYFVYLLGTEAWAIYKGNIKEISETQQSKLLQAYTEIRRYNSMAEFFKFNYSAPKNSMNNQAEQVINACQLVIEELSKD